MKNFIFILLILVFVQSNYAQNEKKELQAKHVLSSIKIDGKLNELSWENADAASGFIQYEPNNGKKADFETKVKVVFDEKAIYIGAEMLGQNIRNVRTDLSVRDDNEPKADIFTFAVNPYDDKINYWEFWVTSANVQGDNFNWNFDWDAVWESETSITDSGWVAEIRIPFSALRIPKDKEQIWAVNFWRNCKETMEWSSWNFMDKNIPGTSNKYGILKGIEITDPPVRLSFTPYLAGMIERNRLGDYYYSYSGGIDLKYGIDESFTLDMMLIPDFSQVSSDDRYWELSAVERKYSEKRQFFTEGAEMFNRAGIFYSRRIGSSPNEGRKAYESINENEYVKELPGETQIINATKISGRTSSNLGIGVFNAMTSNTYAVLKDSVTGNEREVMVQPFTNYNIIVLDQILKNNSYISFINTNVYTPENNFMANVTGTDFKFYDSGVDYSVSGKGIVNMFAKNSVTKAEGFSYELVFGKESGEIKYWITHLVESDKYNPNDLGYVGKNNDFDFYFYTEYASLRPYKNLRSFSSSLSFDLSYQYAPREFQSAYVSWNNNITFEGPFYASLQLFLNPVKSHDYLETRTAGRFVEIPADKGFTLSLENDKQQSLSAFVRLSYSKPDSYNQENYTFVFSPKYIFSNNFRMTLDLVNIRNNNSLGFVNNNPEKGEIFFGRRNINTFINSIIGDYIFSNNLSLNFKIRHYYSAIEYRDYRSLNENGTLSLRNDYTANHNVNYNAFNIDLSLNWIFAPGSELTLMWKNEADNFSNVLNRNLMKNLSNTLISPQSNSLSVKLLYYFDYNNLL